MIMKACYAELIGNIPDSQSQNFGFGMFMLVPDFASGVSSPLLGFTKSPNCSFLNCFSDFKLHFVFLGAVDKRGVEDSLALGKMQNFEDNKRKGIRIFCIRNKS